MGLYDKIKDIASVVQKADNIELYKQLLDIGKEALDMQEEIAKLKEENKQLKEEINLDKKIIRHKDGLYITLEGDKNEIRYCSTCWGNYKKLIQLKNGNTCFNCEKEWRSSVR